MSSKGKKRNQRKKNKKVRRSQGSGGPLVRGLGPGDYRLVSQRDGGFPDSMVTTLSYADTVSLNAASPYSSYVFRGNSLYDPDYTSTGHQPRYFDDLMRVYTKYKVLGLTIRASANNASGAIPVLIMCPLTDVLTSGATAAAVIEFPRAQFVGPMTAASIRSYTMVGSYTTEGICGLSKAQLASEDWSGTSTTSPVSIWYVNFLVVTPTAVNVDMKLTVRIEYTSLFYDRLTPQDSYLKNLIVESPEGWGAEKRPRYFPPSHDATM